ncbi:MAG: CRISPR-associated protein Csx19 [Cyanobacteria bacterium P01_H01_bin.21]
MNNQPELKDIKELPNKDSLRAWIEKKADAHKLQYLLAHADDGVIWGRFNDKKLVTADEINDQKFKQFPKLRLDTLQQCRIFGEQGEVLLWRSSNKLSARFISGNSDQQLNPKPIREHQLLWGTHGIQHGNFTLLRDGSQGLKHGVPLTKELQIDNNEKLANKICLVVHHYIDYDDDGLAHINLSRLVKLTTV